MRNACLSILGFGLAMHTGISSEVSKQMIRPFEVMGIEVQTDNQHEMTANGLIPAQWKKWLGSDLVHQIPNKIGDDVYAVYWHYESDRNGQYNYLIGVKVKSGTAPPKGMTSVRIDGGQYAMFTGEPGPSSTVVPELWKKVWSLEDNHALQRSYKTDFEVYQSKSKSDPTVPVQLFVGTHRRKEKID